MPAKQRTPIADLAWLLYDAPSADQPALLTSLAQHWQQPPQQLLQTEFNFLTLATTDALSAIMHIGKNNTALNKAVSAWPWNPMYDEWLAQHLYQNNEHERLRNAAAAFITSPNPERGHLTPWLTLAMASDELIDQLSIRLQEELSQENVDRALYSFFLYPSGPDYRLHVDMATKQKAAKRYLRLWQPMLNLAQPAPNWLTRSMGMDHSNLTIQEIAAVVLSNQLYLAQGIGDPHSYIPKENHQPWHLERQASSQDIAEVMKIIQEEVNKTLTEDK